MPEVVTVTTLATYHLQCCTAGRQTIAKLSMIVFSQEITTLSIVASNVCGLTLCTIFLRALGRNFKDKHTVNLSLIA